MTPPVDPGARGRKLKAASADLAAIAAVLVVIGQFAGTGAGLPFLLASAVVWTAGLAAVGAYRDRPDEATGAHLLRLGFDHLLVAIGYGIATRFVQGAPDLATVGMMALGAFAAVATLHLATAPGRSDGRFGDFSLLAGDLALVAAAFLGLFTLAPEGTGSLALLGVLLALKAGAAYGLKLCAPDDALPPAARRRGWLVAEVALLAGAAVSTMVPFFDFTLRAWVAFALLRLALVGLGVVLRSGVIGSGPGALHETLRLLLVVAAGVAVTQPFLSANQVGTGDAKLYAEALGDFLAQIKAGIFPPLVSQSEIAPFGAVFPFRMASYHFYFAALLDLLTAGVLSVYALQHLTLVLSAGAGGLVMYLCLRRLAGEESWAAWVLALLYVISPTWLGALYAKDMYFTAMTLPFLPLALIPALEDDQASPRSAAVRHGAALALVWLAHPPVGFWCSVTVVMIQVIRLVLGAGRKAAVVRIAATWAICGLLCAGLFVSLFELRGDSLGGDPSAAVLTQIRDNFPAILLPAASNPDRLGDIQPGYSLLAVLLLSVIGAVMGRRRGALLWFVPTTVLLALILPVPALTEAAWKAMPTLVISVTNIWPMQRILPLLAALIPIAGILVWRHTPSSWRRAGLIVALPALAWSGWESLKYVSRGHAITLAEAGTLRTSRVENSPLLINWLAYLPGIPEGIHPNEVNDPLLLNRILGPDLVTVLASNRDTILATSNRTPAVVASAGPYLPEAWRLSPPVAIEPGRRYLLTLEPTSSTVPGILQLTGPDVFREVRRLAPAGGEIHVPLWTTATSTQALDLHYVPAEPRRAGTPVPAFVSYRLLPYPTEQLPVQVTAFAPYRAKVTAPAAGVVETHRFHVAGYRATVDGQSVEVLRSPRGYAAVPVPAGASLIALDYQGSGLLRTALGLTLIAWILAGIVLVRDRRTREQRP